MLQAGGPPGANGPSQEGFAVSKRRKEMEGPAGGDQRRWGLPRAGRKVGCLLGEVRRLWELCGGRGGACRCCHGAGRWTREEHSLRAREADDVAGKRVAAEMVEGAGLTGAARARCGETGPAITLARRPGQRRKDASPPTLVRLGARSTGICGGEIIGGAGLRCH